MTALPITPLQNVPALSSQQAQGRIRGLMTAAVAAAMIGGPQLVGASPAGSQPGFTLAPYGWLAGLDGNVKVPGDDFDPGDGSSVFNRLNFELTEELDTVGFMFYGEWRGERWMAFFDSVWANVSQDADVKLGRLLPASQTSAAVDGNIYQLALGYRLIDWENASLTVFGGARYYDIETTVEASGGILPRKVEVSSNREWTDAVIGGRWRYNISQHWHTSVQLDYGYGESDLSWQAFATLGYGFSWGSIEGWWRHLALDYDSRLVSLDLGLTGPFLGASIRF
tara:strand:- start:454657 stop:455502 length:846 start_codon:yes stop_codon:yes gene_type:complete